MRNLKKISRESLKKVSGGSRCNDACPAGPYGPNFIKSCEDFNSLPQCCKARVLVHSDCFSQ